MAKVIGIDPGLSGGVTVFGCGSPLAIYKMPVVKSGTKKVLDTHNFVEILKAFNDVDVAVIEKVHAMPGQGVSSMFNFGMGFGILQGALAALSIPMLFVTPQTWQKGIFNGIDSKLGKKRSIVYCKSRWPDIGKWSDGTADAACIALYGANQLCSK